MEEKRGFGARINGAFHGMGNNVRGRIDEFGALSADEKITMLEKVSDNLETVRFLSE